jgi:hypothetical protein
MKQKNTYGVTIFIIAIVVGVAGFFGGMQYQKTQSQQNFRQFTAAGGPPGATQRMQRFGNNQNGPVRGEIISLDDTSITIKMQDGSTKIVILSDKTTINKSSTGSKSDLKSGDQVTAFGSSNSDGSITAQMVSLGSGMPQGSMMNQK